MEEKDIMRLPKGHRVIFAYPIKEYDKFIAEKKAKFNVSTTEDSDKIFVVGIVVGDTIENGLSIVSEDNPKWCIALMKSGRDKHWETCFWQGYFHVDADVTKEIGVNPTCPY